MDEIYGGFLVIHLKKSHGPIFTQLVCEQRQDVKSLKITLFQKPPCLEKDSAVMKSTLLNDCWLNMQ